MTDDTLREESKVAEVTDKPITDIHWAEGVGQIIIILCAMWIHPGLVFGLIGLIMMCIGRDIRKERRAKAQATAREAVPVSDRPAGGSSAV